MNFLERALRRGISDGIGRAVGNAISKAVEPKAAELASKAARQLDQHSQSTVQQGTQTVKSLEGALANLERAAQGYATEISKNIKICPSCGQGVTADKKFCPECGTRLPDQTAADNAVCPSCGKQNAAGNRFCQECGTKLPAALNELPKTSE